MVKNPTKVSIVVPVYNVEQYLVRCLDSCISQTLMDIDIICVDDGSTDNSGKMLDEYALKDARITVLHKENGGLSSARNAGIKLAKGSFITFLDSDDFIEPNFCEKIWTASMNAWTEIIVFNTKIFPEKPKANIWYYDVLTKVKDREYKKFSPYILFWETGGHPFVWRQAFSRELLERTGVLFDETVRYGEDLIFECEIFPLANDFTFISDALYNYMWIREGSLMSGLDKDMNVKINLHLDMVEIIADFWQSHGLIDKYGREFLQWILEFIMVDIMENNLCGDDVISSRFCTFMDKYNLDSYSKHLSVISKKRYKAYKNMR